jgi:hypothetical protein
MSNLYLLYLLYPLTMRIVTRNSERRHDKCGSTPLFERTHFARG